MDWLTPMTGLLAAAAAVPALLLLYFLKLKRSEQIVSSTLLWQRAVRDMQVNAPFQRLRRNLLLLLQLLALLSVLVALAGPILSLASSTARRYVLLIDRSASMNAREGNQSRLNIAQERALAFVESLRDRTTFSFGDDADQAMVIAFDEHAKVMCNFTSDRHKLATAIKAIEPGDGKTELAEAVTIAQAFAQSPGREANDRSAETPAQLELFSDGAISDLADIGVRTDGLTYHRIGEAFDNVALVAMQARRSYEKANEVNVFAAFANYTFEPVVCDVQLSVDGNVHAVREVSIPAATETKAATSSAGVASADVSPVDSTNPARNNETAEDAGSRSSGPEGSTAGDADTANIVGEAVSTAVVSDRSIRVPGKSSVSFTLRGVEAGVLEVRQLRSDVLACDDAAWTILEPPRQLTALLVSPGNSVLKSALQACPLSKLDICSPAEFDAMDHATLNTDRPYDVIVLDRHVPAQLPRGCYMVFAKPPSGIGVDVAGEVKNQVVVDWRPRHPVLQYVNMSGLFALRCYQLDLPRDAEVLAEFNDVPALALLRRGGSTFLLAGFDLLETNWPFEVGFAMFCHNATTYLGLEAGGHQQRSLAVGEPIVIEDSTPHTEAMVDGPGFSKTKLTADAAGTFRFAGTALAGVYRLAVGDSTHMFAVNLLDAKESDVTPIGQLTLAGQGVVGQDSALGGLNTTIWPFLVVAALLLVSLEWLVYNSRIRLG